jgi:DNA polymerase (family X)
MKQADQPSSMNKFGVAAALQEIGQLLELKGADRFRARAYGRASRAVADFAGDLDVLVKQNRLTEIKGIGSALAAQVAEIYVTGRSSFLERLRAELPSGVIELSRVLSLKKIEKLHEALGIRNITELKAASEAGKVRKVPGFGLKSEQKILEEIEAYESRGERILLLHALRMGQRILDYMQTTKDLAGIELAGSVRRWKETVSTIRVVAGARRDHSTVLDHFLRFPLITNIEKQTDSGCSVRLTDNMRVSFTVVPIGQYPLALYHETGSPAHVRRLEDVAQSKGLELSERSLRRVRPRVKEIALKTEADIFNQLGMQYIPPELREDEGEIEQAIAGELPEDLLTIEEIKGMVHCHTTYSDGRNTVEEMALAAEAMGMKYITITDHSPTAFYAGGVKVDRLKRQWDEIDRVQEKVNVKLLRGTESDILRNGALDYPDSILEKFDVIIASIHNRYKMNEDQMTRCLKTAMKNPFFKIWGHPLGRLIQRRPPFACRVEEVLDAIAQSRAAIEINGDPYRLDMEPRWLKEARKRGVKFVISTDAHSTSDMKHLPFGIGIARRAAIRTCEVLNTLSADRFRKHVRPA